MKTALACMALAPVLSPAKHYATALGGSGTPSLGTQVPWHDIFGCSEYLFYDMASWACAESVSEPKFGVTMVCFGPSEYAGSWPGLSSNFRLLHLSSLAFACCDSYCSCVF
ncbi:unnamed protein product [Ectocarpus sp. 6 AP-2014]